MTKVNEILRDPVSLELDGLDRMLFTHTNYEESIGSTAMLNTIAANQNTFSL